MDFNFIEYDSNDLKKDMFNNASESLKKQGADDWTLYPGDERYQLLSAMTYCNMVMLAKINKALLNSTINGATAEALDEVGKIRNCYRKEPGKSTVTLRFSLLNAVTKDSIIVKGTKVTSDKKIFFVTKESCTIPAGQLYADVLAECTTGGTESQKYDIGKINTIVDVTPASGVKNLDIPSGADNGEPYPYDPVKHPDGDNGEGDELFRERIKIAYATVSTAGAEFTYEYWAKSANSTICDVRVLSYTDMPNVIDLYVLCAGDVECAAIKSGKYSAGVLPSESILQSVLEKCQAKFRRPQGDKVSAFAPEIVNYDIELKYFTTVDEEQQCIETIEGAGGAIQKYLEWQDSVIGKHINPDKLEALCVHPNWDSYKTLQGAVRVELVKPEHLDLIGKQVARFSGNLTITHGIVSDY